MAKNTKFTKITNTKTWALTSVCKSSCLEMLFRWMDCFNCSKTITSTILLVLVVIGSSFQFLFSNFPCEAINWHNVLTWLCFRIPQEMHSFEGTFIGTSLATGARHSLHSANMLLIYVGVVLTCELTKVPLGKRLIEASWSNLENQHYLDRHFV